VDLSNIAWAFASLPKCDLPLLQALSEASIRLVPDFSAQNITNTAWAFARCGIPDAPLFASIAEAAIAKLGDFDAQNMACTAWSFELLRYTLTLGRFARASASSFFASITDLDAVCAHDGMSWIDYVTAAAPHLETSDSQTLRAQIDSHIMASVRDRLTQLTSRTLGSTHDEDFARWQDFVVFANLAYLGIDYTEKVMGAMGVVVC